MTNCLRTCIDDYDDINTKDQYQVALDAGCTVEQALQACCNHSRDNGRTPVQWTAGANAGFTTGTPWLKVNPNYVDINVAEQLGREDSVLRYYQRLLALRKSEAWCPTFVYGGFVPAYETEDHIMAYIREDEHARILVAANFGAQPQRLPLEGAQSVLLSDLGREAEVLEEITASGAFTLASGECAVILL